MICSLNAFSIADNFLHELFLVFFKIATFYMICSLCVFRQLATFYMICFRGLGFGVWRFGFGF